MLDLVNFSFSNEFNLATFVVGLLSLIGVIANIVVTSSFNKKKRYTDLITTNRVSTMQNLKKSLSDCIKSVHAVMLPKANLQEQFNNFEYNKSQIFYAINFKGVAETEMRNTLELLHSLLFSFIINNETLSKKQTNLIFETLNSGVEYLQTISTLYCKCEWERAKNTSLYGDKEKYNTEHAFDNYYKEQKQTLDAKKEFLTKNTFDVIAKTK